MTKFLPYCNQGTLFSVRSTVLDAWRMRRAWWFTATARSRARFARTFFGSFWLGLSNLLSIAALALVYGTVFKAGFNTCGLSRGWLSGWEWHQFSS